VRLPEAQLVFDTTRAKIVAPQAKHDAMRQLSDDSWFRWPCVPHDRSSFNVDGAYDSSAVDNPIARRALLRFNLHAKLCAAPHERPITW